METLSHIDLLSLNSAICEIYSARDQDSFFQSAFGCIQGMIPCELCSSGDINVRTFKYQTKMLTSSPDHEAVASKHMHAFQSLLHEHPLYPDVLHGKVLKTTDYASRKQFKGTALHEEYYRHLEVETQLCFSLPVSEDLVSLWGLSRRFNVDFSERDRFLLTLLKPHLLNAMRNIAELGSIRIERDLLERGAESEKNGVILCKKDGAVVHISALAREMVAKYFAAHLVAGSTLPGALGQWFHAEAHALFGNRIEREPFTLAQKNTVLTIKLLKDCTTDEYILFMSERDHALRMQSLQRYNLTKRESEVLLWLGQGKTNLEIATILGISKRTTEKHLEHVFAKLGVETRVAAAALIKKI